MILSICDRVLGYSPDVPDYFSESGLDSKNQKDFAKDEVEFLEKVLEKA